MLRGFAIMLCIVPSVNLALSGFAMAELRYASGLFNLMRNLGGAIGIAVVNTWLQNYTRIDVARIGESLGEAGRHAPDVVGGLSERIGLVTPDPAHALLLAQGEFAHVVSRYALTLSFNEVFRQMAWLFIAALILVPFCRPAANLPAATSEAH
jgi:DHA2 family multidrug resistance protein